MIWEELSIAIPAKDWLSTLPAVFPVYRTTLVAVALLPNVLAEFGTPYVVGADRREHLPAFGAFYW